MKRVLLWGALVSLFVLSASGCSVYQGMAYRDKLPLVGFDFVNWPEQQPSTDELYNDDFERIRASLVSALKQQQAEIAAPGYTAAIAIDGEVIWAGAVGWADIAQQKHMTIDTRLRVGSTSKAITSTGLARLVADKKLDIDAPVFSYFDTLPNTKWANITARQLASHMAGIPHYKENTEVLGRLQTVSAQTHYSNVLDALTLFDESETLFEPGEEFSYSSLGTVLLSALMQIKAEQKYQGYMQQSVFDVLGMNSTSEETSVLNSDELAQFYWQNRNQITELKPWYDVDLSHRLAGGGWVSTSVDLVRLGQGFINDDFIPEYVRETFWTPQKLNSGEINPQKYGIGWRVHDLNLGESFKKTKYMHHGGVSAGAQSFLMVVPEYRLSIAVNANVRTKVFWDFGKVSYELARIVVTDLEHRAQSDSIATAE